MGHNKESTNRSLKRFKARWRSRTMAGCSDRWLRSLAGMWSRDQGPRSFYCVWNRSVPLSKFVVLQNQQRWLSWIPQQPRITGELPNAPPASVAGHPEAIQMVSERVLLQHPGGVMNLGHLPSRLSDRCTRWSTWFSDKISPLQWCLLAKCARTQTMPCRLIVLIIDCG